MLIINQQIQKTQGRVNNESYRGLDLDPLQKTRRECVRDFQLDTDLNVRS